MNLEESLLSGTYGKQWERIGVRHHHGIDVHLASLHTEKSCGIGEFNDLIPLIDWCSKHHFDVIQLLPINDTGDDPSPYFALSSCALHPIYLSLRDLPDFDRSKELDELAALTKLSRVDYHRVQKEKMNLLRSYFEKVGHKLTQEKDYLLFIQNNPWVKPYGLFKTLRALLGNTNWQTWPKQFRTPTSDLLFMHEKEVSFYTTLQYLCYLQLSSVKTYAHSKQVYLKGDLPILISDDSSDAWQNPHEFDLTMAAGAPPDQYNTLGQYWGFPLLHWDIMRQNKFAFWKQRLKYASHLYDLMRIDHVLGFFRIWAIPLHKSPKAGQYLPTDKNLWLPQGHELLSLISTITPMLPIAEDLGTVPDGVREQLTELGIPGTRVMRWERRWKTDERFIPLQDYPPISMTTLSTHDSETLTLWWRDQPKEASILAAEKKWTYAPELTQEQRRSLLWDSHHTSSLFHINLLGEYLALHPSLVWPTPEDERINIPGKILSANWTYRIRPSIEMIQQSEALSLDLKQILS